MCGRFGATFDFRGSAMKRAKWRGIVRNTCNALGNAGLRRGTEVGDRIYSILEKFTENADKVISESAQWALSRIQ